MERAWTQKSGLVWRGKHSLLIQKNKGSFFFLAELILDLELENDVSFKTNHCGKCTRCVDACPTQAILPNNTVDGSKCISYFTIELKDELLATMKRKFEDWMFDCDIYQGVCPWNRLANPHSDLLEMTKKDWEEIAEDVFKKVFKKSAVKRTKFAGLQRNIKFLKN